MKFIAVISVLFCTLSAQEYSPAEVFENIRTRYSGMNDASALFTQQVFLRFKKNGQTVSGAVKIKKGNKYRLETGQQTIVTDGVTIWMYNPISKQVLRDSYKQNRVQFSPDKFLLGLPKELTALSLVKDSNDVILTLQPVQSSMMSSMLTSLRVWVNSTTWIFHKIEMSDKNSTISTFTLTDIRFNQGIPDDTFTFEITKEMKVVDLKAIQ